MQFQRQGSGMPALALILCLLLKPCIHIAELADFEKPVTGMHYVSWLEPETGAGAPQAPAPTPAPTSAPDPASDCSSWQFNPELCGGSVLEGVSSSDDLHQTVNLALTGLRGSFPFLGRARSHVDVSANGVLMFDTTDVPVCQFYVAPAMQSHTGETAMNLYNCWMQGVTRDINLQSTYFATVAVLMADLNPAMAQPYGFVGWSNYYHSGANVSANASAAAGGEEDGIMVHYVNLPFFDPAVPSNITARVRLRRSGQTTIYWERLGYDGATCGSSCGTDYLQSGIRGAPAAAANVSSALRLGTRQEQVYADHWHSQVPAVMPPHPADVANATLFQLCPLSDAWCMRPSLLPVVNVSSSDYISSYSAQAQVLTLRTLSFSCAADFDGYLCVFSTLDTANPLHGTYAGQHRTSPGNGQVAAVATATLRANTTATAHTSRPTFICDVPLSVASTEGSYGVSLYATFAAERGVLVDGEHDSVTLIAPVARNETRPSYQADTLALSVLPAGDPRLLQADLCSPSAALSASSALQRPPKDAYSADLACGACTLCGGLEQEQDDAAAAEVAETRLQACLFDTGELECEEVTTQPDCRGYCDNSNTTMLAANLHYAREKEDGPIAGVSQYQCCDRDELDCAGLCRGGHVIARAQRSARLEYTRSNETLIYSTCCPAALVAGNGNCCIAQTPDCTGACGGAAKLDCMGVCEGQATMGSWCLHPSGAPTSQPTSFTPKPTLFSQYPTGQPSRQPSGQPSAQPTRQPTAPTSTPTGQPTTAPSSAHPTGQPSALPSSQPSAHPTSQPTSPTSTPTGQPTGQPAALPTSQPSTPTSMPSRAPTGQPTRMPTRVNPTFGPTFQPPTGQPTGQPTVGPSAQPSMGPSGQPTSAPSSCETVAGNRVNVCGDCEAAGSYGFGQTIGEDLLPIANASLCEPLLVLADTTDILVEVSFAEYQVAALAASSSYTTVEVELRTLNYFPLEVSVTRGGSANLDPVLSAPSSFAVPCCNEPRTLTVRLDMTRLFSRSLTSRWDAQAWEPKEVALLVRRLSPAGEAVGASRRHSLRINPAVSDCEAVPEDSPALCGALPRCYFCQLGYPAKSVTSAVESREGVAYAYSLTLKDVYENHRSLVSGSSSRSSSSSGSGSGSSSSSGWSNSDFVPFGGRRLYMSGLPDRLAGQQKAQAATKDQSLLLAGEQLFRGKCITGTTAHVCKAATALDLAERQRLGEPLYLQSLQAALSTGVFSPAFVRKDPTFSRGLLVVLALGSVAVCVGVRLAYRNDGNLDHEQRYGQI